MTTTNANETQNPPGNKPADSVINISSTNGEVEVSSENVKLFLPSILGYEKIARGAAQALAEQIDMPEARIEDLKTAVAEACMNAIEHGNSLESGINVTVVMRISEDKLEVSVADVGEDAIPTDFEPGSRPMRGWGMFFIRNLVDEIEISRLPEGGNEVRMAIYLVPPHGDGATIADKVEADSNPGGETPSAAGAASAVTEAKPSVVQPVADKPSAVQPVGDKPSAVQTVEEQPSAISPVTDSAPKDVAAQSTKTEQPASSSQQTSGSLTSDVAASETASEKKPPTQESVSPSSDAPTTSSPES